MKVYTNLIVWVDYNPAQKLYLLGYAGCDDIIKSIHLDDADTLSKFIWDMLHEDKRAEASIEERLCKEEQK